MLHPNIHAAYNKGRGEVAEKDSVISYHTATRIKKRKWIWRGCYL